MSTGSAHAVTELVVNGSFEANSFSGSVIQTNTVTGWTSNSTGVKFEIQKGATQGGQKGFNSVAADGVQYLELNTDRLTSISQTLATTAGADYALSFAYSGRPNTATSAMNVYWGDTLLTPKALVGTTTGTWQTYSLNVAALSDSTALRFESVGPTTTTSLGSYLDNVSVISAVPEPQTYAMMLLGLGLVGFMVRRKSAA